MYSSSDEKVSLSCDIPVVNQDPINHLSCRQTQILAISSAFTRWTPLLFHRTLESTIDIYRHCWTDGLYRWSYAPAHVGDDAALRALGVDLQTGGKHDLNSFRLIARDFLKRGMPVMTWAPRGHFDYWIDFMRRCGTKPEEHFELHSFLVYAETATGWTVYDTTHDDHRFRPHEVTWAEVERGWASDPQRFFLDAQVLGQQRAEPDLDWFAERYRTFVAGHRDDGEIYEFIAARLPGEFRDYPETYRVPSINAIALLAGSRDFFHRFLRRTAHSDAVAGAYGRIARDLRAIFDGLQQEHAGFGGGAMADLQRRIAALQTREIRALDRLRDEAGRLSRPLDRSERT